MYFIALYELTILYQSLRCFVQQLPLYNGMYESFENAAQANMETNWDYGSGEWCRNMSQQFEVYL